MSTVLVQQSTQPTNSNQTITNEQGTFVKSFLISTKMNDMDWRISRETGHEDVKTFLGTDFAIMKDLIHKPVSEGGGGHIRTPGRTRESVLKAYADNSHGKLIKLDGPHYYADSPDDYWYDAWIKLKDTQAAQVLREEGEKTWNGYDVSPHLFINTDKAKGDDRMGWSGWQGVGLNLVIRGAYGPQAIITKWCEGTEDSCTAGDKSLTASSSMDPNTGRCELAEILTSHISKFASSSHTMPEGNSSTNVGEVANKAPDSTKPGNTTVDPQKALSTAPQVDQNQKVMITAEELAILKQKADAVTEMENERKAELLTTLFESFPEGEERDKAIKEFGKQELKTVKLLKNYHDRLLPKIEAKVKAQLKAESKEGGEDEEGGGGEGEGKNAKAKSAPEKKEEDRAGSTAGPEPGKTKFNSPNHDPGQGEDRSASGKEVRNEVYLLRKLCSEIGR